MRMVVWVAWCTLTQMLDDIKSGFVVSGISAKVVKTGTRVNSFLYHKFESGTL